MKSGSTERQPKTFTTQSNLQFPEILLKFSEQASCRKAMSVRIHPCTPAGGYMTHFSVDRQRSRLRQARAPA